MPKQYIQLGSGVQSVLTVVHSLVGLQRRDTLFITINIAYLFINEIVRLFHLALPFQKNPFVVDHGRSTRFQSILIDSVLNR